MFVEIPTPRNRLFLLKENEILKTYFILKNIGFIRKQSEFNARAKIIICFEDFKKLSIKLEKCYFYKKVFSNFYLITGKSNQYPLKEVLLFSRN